MSADGFRIPVRGQKTIECPQCNFAIETVPLKILKSKILIVEGRDDLEFFEALVNKLQISDIQIIDFNGKYGWREKLSGLIQDRNFIKVISLGLIRDADLNATDTFRSVKNALKANGLPIPNRPLTAAKGMPKVNVLIVPPEKKEGTLEELCLNAVVDDPALICVNQYFECLNLFLGLKYNIINHKSKEQTSPV
jgi:hypothetical protein